jgi:hypothetical protein
VRLQVPRLDTQSRREEERLSAIIVSVSGKKSRVAAGTRILDEDIVSLTNVPDYSAIVPLAIAARGRKPNIMWEKSGIPLNHQKKNVGAEDEASRQVVKALRGSGFLMVKAPEIKKVRANAKHGTSASTSWHIHGRSVKRES